MGPPPVVTPLAAEGPGPLLVLETVEPLAAELVAVPVTALPVTALLVPLAVPVAALLLALFAPPTPAGPRPPCPPAPAAVRSVRIPERPPQAAVAVRAQTKTRKKKARDMDPVKRTQPSHSSFGSSLLQTCLWQEADEGVERDEALCFCQCTSPMSQDWQGTSTSSGDAPP